MNAVQQPPTGNGGAKRTIYTVYEVAYVALDPVHIGAGGHRLGRVDMTIVREPGTRLPKIPGTSLSGAARSYAALLYNKPEAAGQQKDLKDRSSYCPILHTFGSATDDDRGNAGTVSICDARILLFPVATAMGPVWITTPGLLSAAGFDHTFHPAPEGIATNLPFPAGSARKQLNLGWILFGDPGAGKLGDGKKDSAAAALSGSEFQPMLERLVAVPETVFSALVNSNLEVRTSVSISPKTGVAEGGALFSYEALPRLTVLAGEIVEDDHRDPSFQPVSRQYSRPAKDGAAAEEAPGPLDPPWNRPAHVVKAGLSLMEHLGVGGMGTRGFGRLRALWPKEAQC